MGFSIFLICFLLGITAVHSIWKCKDDTSDGPKSPKHITESDFKCPPQPSTEMIALHMNTNVDKSLQFNDFIQQSTTVSVVPTRMNKDRIHAEIRDTFKRLGFLKEDNKMDVPPQQGQLLIRYTVNCTPPNNDELFVQEFRTGVLNFNLTDLCAQAEDFFISFKATEYELGQAIGSWRADDNPVTVSYEEGLYFEDVDKPLKMMNIEKGRRFDPSFIDFWKDLFANMTKSISQSNTTGVNWDSIGRTWDPSDLLVAEVETRVQKTFTIPEEHVAKVYQLVGKCGPFIYRGEVNIILYDNKFVNCEVGWKGTPCPFKTMPEIENFLKFV